MFEPGPAPEPSAHLPVPQFTQTCQDRQVVDVGFQGDALAAFNQTVMNTQLPPLYLLLSSSLRGSARRTNLPFLVFASSLCAVLYCEQLIYANKPCLLCTPLFLCLRLCLCLGFTCILDSLHPPGILVITSGMFSPKRISSFTGNFD